MWAGNLMVKRRLYDLAVILFCLSIWPLARMHRFPGEMRQACAPLFEAVDRLQSALPPGDSTIYVITQDFVWENLLWREIAYRLVPHRTLRLPRNLQPLPAGPAVPQDPRQGSAANLGETVCFSSGAAFVAYLRTHPVSHLLLARGDPELTRLTGLPLAAERMYLLEFRPEDGCFVELAHVARP